MRSSKGPVQGKIYSGRAYIDENFPLTDSFETCQVERKKTRKRQVDSSAQADIQKQRRHELHREHVRNEKRQLHDRDEGASAAAARHHRDGSPGGGGRLDAALTVDSKLVLAAVVILVVIWAWTRPILKRTSKKDRKSSD